MEDARRQMRRGLEHSNLSKVAECSSIFQEQQYRFNNYGHTYELWLNGRTPRCFVWRSDEPGKWRFPCQFDRLYGCLHAPSFDSNSVKKIELCKTLELQKPELRTDQEIRLKIRWNGGAGHFRTDQLLGFPPFGILHGDRMLWQTEILPHFIIHIEELPLDCAERSDSAEIFKRWAYAGCRLPSPEAQHTPNQYLQFLHSWRNRKAEWPFECYYWAKLEVRR